MVPVFWRPGSHETHCPRCCEVTHQPEQEYLWRYSAFRPFWQPSPAAYVKDKYAQITTIEIADSIESAIANTDIVIETTTTDIAGSDALPYFPKHAIKPGALMLMPAAARFDDDFIINDARPVLDARGLYNAWAEEYETQAYQLLGIPGTHFHDLMRAGKQPEYSTLWGPPIIAVGSQYLRRWEPRPTTGLAIPERRQSSRACISFWSRSRWCCG